MCRQAVGSDADAGQMKDVNAEESNRNLKRHQYLPAQVVCRAPTLRAVALSDAGVRMLMECRREQVEKEVLAASQLRTKTCWTVAPFLRHTQPFGLRHGPTRVSSTEDGQAVPASPGKSEVPASAPTVGP